MEKIYMDDGKNQKKQSFFKKFFNDKGSMGATIVVAIVGIVGLVAFGFNQISFAADAVSGLPSTFVSGEGEGTTRTYGESSAYSGEAISPILGFYAIVDDDGTKVPMFCTEYNVDFGVGVTYTEGPEITDQGLIYLMSQLYPNKELKDANGVELDENVQIWITQNAIWSYLFEIGDSNNSDFGNNDKNAKVKAVDRIYMGSDSSTAGSDPLVATPGSTVFEAYGINTLIATAKQYRTNPFVTLNVNKASETISITNDDKYYQSDLVSVIGGTSSPLINRYEGYSVTIKKAPEGTILVDENGNVYDDIQKMSPTSKFYVRVPVDKVTDSNKNIEINIRGNFSMYGANAYTSGNYQKVANVGILDKSEDKPLNIQLNYTPDIPDTGMNAIQIIYFAGLILLLSGVGIIYVNAKPEKNN